MRRGRKKKVVKVDMARICMVSSDGSQDLYIPRALARQLDEQMLLAVDLTSSKQHERVYCPYPGKSVFALRHTLVTKYGAARNR